MDGDSVIVRNRIRLENVPGDYKQMLLWLGKNIEPANRYNSENYPAPYWASGTSQFAKFVGETSLWHLEVRGPNLTKVIEIYSVRMAVKFALECTNAK